MNGLDGATSIPGRIPHALDFSFELLYGLVILRHAPPDLLFVLQRGPTHLSLDKDAPEFRRRQKIGRIAAIPILGGLHHQYVRV